MELCEWVCVRTIRFSFIRFCSIYFSLLLLCFGSLRARLFGKHPFCVRVYELDQNFRISNRCAENNNNHTHQRFNSCRDPFMISSITLALCIHLADLGSVNYFELFSYWHVSNSFHSMSSIQPFQRSIIRTHISYGWAQYAYTHIDEQQNVN